MTIEEQVRQLFSTGCIYTARQINQTLHINDARKVISNLRKQGVDITDKRYGRYKRYWLNFGDKGTPPEKTYKQLSLNFATDDAGKA